MLGGSHLLQRADMLGGFLQRGAQGLNARAGGFAKVGQGLACGLVEGGDRLREVLLHELLIFVGPFVQAFRLLSHHLRCRVQPGEELCVRAGEGGGEHIGQRAHVATGGVRAVVEAGQENFVTVGVNVAEVVLFNFLERGHRQAEDDGIDQRQQRRVEGGGQTAGDAAHGLHEQRGVFDRLRVHHALEVADGVRETDDGADEPEDGNRPDEHLDQREAAADARAVNVRLVRHHGRDLAINLTRLEKLQGLADAVDHQAIAQLHRQRINVLDEDMDVALVDIGAQFHRHHVQPQRALLVAQLEQQKHMVIDPAYSIMQSKWTKDETGNRMKTETPKRLRRWWHEVGQDGYVLCVRYGAKPIEFEKGKAAVAAVGKDGLKSANKK